ncbi:MAG TPA: LytTR family DNA-binding domain-containing protein [Bryobacteraceae bacterium]|nr:LytTR family DNA-binding domain-containing protein [Bryobacteraceae bacterium]
MSSISAVLVDDEQLARSELAFLLKSFPDVEVVGIGSNGLEALDLIEQLEPDVAFLDVQMPGLDGLGVIRKLRERESHLPHFVLATAFDHYAVEAFRLDAMDYILKPFDRERLHETIQRAQKVVAERRLAHTDAPRHSVHRSKILVKNSGRSFIVDAQDIVYATIEDGLISIVTQQMEGESNYRTIEELQSNLDPDTFWRVHRSYLININKIREVIPWFNSSYQLKMDDKKQTEIPVSRVQTKRLRSLLKL